MRSLTSEDLELLDSRVNQAEPYFGGGDTGELLQGRYGTDPVYRWFEKRHRATSNYVVGSDGYCRIRDDDGTEHSWHVPYGVRWAMSQRLSHAQIVSKYPWYVTWVSPKKGKRLKKKFQSLAHAIVFITTRAQYVDSNASVICRHGFDIPEKLRGKLPNPKLGYWCPCCLTARKFYAVWPEQRFTTFKKVVADDGSWDFKLRELKVLRCKVCGITNRDQKFRRSNQPWTKRRFKRGARRAKRGR